MGVQGTNETLPSIAEIAAKMSTAAEAAPGESKGGTATDPAIPAQGDGAVAAVAATTEEAPKVEAPKAEEKKDPSSSRFAALARREKAAREQEATVQRRVSEMEARESAIKEREARFDSSKKRPMAALRELGFTYADLTQDVLGGYKEPEEDPLDKKLKPFKDKWDKFEPNVEALQKEVQELKNAIVQRQQTESYDKAMTEIRATAADPEKYELINTFGDEAIDLIRDTVVEYFNKNQKLLDYSEACDIVEKYYEEEYLSKLSNTKKFKAKTPTSPATPTQTKPTTIPGAKEPKPTLTNRQQTATEAKPVNIDDLPKHEAIAYLAKRLQFK